MARINSVLRRRGPVPTVMEATPADAALAPTQHYAFAGLSFMSSTGTLRRGDGSAVRLSTVEARLLGVLLSHPNTILSRQRLIDLTARPGCEVYDRAIDRQISRLRRKLDDNPLEPQLLRTIWGDGYMLAASVAALDA
ncbi:DNA-binding response regulator [Pseudomonas syringae pv. maculicola str. M6]|nr:DNA-binding response regulator [Pseudomonas syringae pv. maculicola str. M6]